MKEKHFFVWFDNEVVKTLWSPPYALNSSWEGWYFAFEPLATVGEHVITVEPFDETWQPLPSQTFTLNVVDTSCEEGFEKTPSGECVEVSSGITSFALYKGDSPDGKLRIRGPLARECP